MQALKLIGDYAQKRSKQNILSQIVENPNSNGQYNTVLIIVFTYNDNKIIFDEVEIEEFTLNKLDKYAYKYGSSRGGDLTPTSKLTDLQKTFKRIRRPLKKLCKKLKGNTENEKIILQIYNILKNKDKNEIIYQKLEEKLKNIENKAVLTIAVRDKEGILKYVGDFQEFIESLMERYEKKFYYKSSYRKREKESIGEDNVCYICSQKADETYGYVGTYSFYTLDKPGFTSGGFKRGEAWKNYPVCPQCAKTLDIGKDYLENNLSARFCGLDYLIIPKTIFDVKEDAREEFFEILEDLDKHKKMSLKEDTRARLTNTQDDLFEAMSEFNNYVNFNLMFYDEQNSAFRILLYVEDVVPSYIQKIFAVKKKVEEEDIFTNLTGKDGEIFSLDFKFNLISDFFYINQPNKLDFTEQFLEITDKIFTGRKISYLMLIDRFTNHLQEKFRNDESIWYDNLKAIMILKFLKKLGLLSKDGREEIRLETKAGKYKQQIQNFLDKHNDVLNNNIKRLVFLEGILAQNLLDIQKKRTDGSTPFRARLNGLKLNKKIVKRLYPEMINKLEEYGENYYKQLEQLISHYALNSSFADVSNNELSFYFVTGMNQAHKFKFNKKKQEDDNK